MRSSSIFHSPRVRALVLATGILGGVAQAQTFPVLAGDPVDPATSRAYPMLPGVPLILPQANGKFEPPIVVAGTIGDVDLVIRAGSPAPGPSMPPPSAVPPVAIAGGTRVTGGTDVPYTVIVSDGSAGLGVPLLGAQMDGIPVIVFAFADLDGDGFVGPTNDDAAGASDNLRERQESDFVVGRSAAIFTNGVAQGTIAIWRGAPASSGGLHVVLTAAAYVGPFSPGFMLGNVPDGPAITTLLPFFPRLDPDRVIESGGRGGPAGPEVRLGVQTEPAFDPPVGDPDLGTPFALPTDGSSPTIDRVLVQSGEASRVRFVQPSIAAGFPVGMQLPLVPGAGGALVEPLAGVAVADDGPGNTRLDRLVPVDFFDNVTDPPGGMTATLVAGPGLRIVTPDTDGDPSLEIVPVATAAGIDVELDDTGIAGDGPATSTLTVLRDGIPVETLAVALVPGGGTTTTITTTTSTTTIGSTLTTTTSLQTTTTQPPGGTAPTIVLATVAGPSSTFAVGCHVTRTLVVVVSDPDGDVSAVSASVVLGGAAPVVVPLMPDAAPAGVSVPPGAVFTGVLDVDPSAAGLATMTFSASDGAGHAANPVGISVPIATSVAPAVEVPGLSPSILTAGTKTVVTIGVRVSDDCGLKRVWLEANRGKGFRKFAMLHDEGRRGDVTAADGVFGAIKRVKLPVGSISVRAAARNRHGQEAMSAPVVVQAVP